MSMKDVLLRLDNIDVIETDAPVSNDNVSNPPTDAELDIAFGNASDLQRGFIGLVDDGGTQNTVWLCAVVGGISASWWYVGLTKAV